MPDQTQGFRLIKAGLLIDGKGGPPVERGAVLVQGSRIIAVGPEREVVPPEGVTAEIF
ncbi:MAG TPA: D-aminoacylase, partial [Dehalococcoidia bacterium]|nr:D-aminoacylase [Dehalococcoidia bacterium]